ncbi:DNA methyltransferase [Candidatus Poribacteria bacterium]|nr:DNA methyltransferase [Candidatus Poribacteria bacterium]
MHNPLTTHDQCSPRKQRAELTFKHNVANGRHGWLRLTPAYSVKVVEDILNRKQGCLNVVDPFSGTGTTALCAAMRGHNATGIDINPFLVWFGNAKVRRYSKKQLAEFRNSIAKLLAGLRDSKTPVASPPPIFNILRWWEQKNLTLLCRLKGAIDHSFPEDEPVRDLLLIAFCRTMISLSNAAFNHQSMSFKSTDVENKQIMLFSSGDQAELEKKFSDDVAFVAAGAADNPDASASVLFADAREVPRVFAEGTDLFITSPPYPNRMSYIRELRPFMYWLGFLKEAPEAGELDWRAIGGTWGVATSRVAAWEKNPDTYFPAYLDKLLEGIRSASAKSGGVLSNYVGRYFEDIWSHLRSAVKVMKPGAEMHYIVGNSKFYDVLVPVETIYRDMLEHLGVAQTEIIPLRKRNSKKELVEYDVIAAV